MVMGKNGTADQIAAVALRLLEEKGPEAVSMRQVARRVGVTPMAIYHHFPHRQALLRTVTDREFAGFAGYMDRCLRHTRPESRLLRVMDSYLDYAFKHPRVFDYVFSQYRSDARRFPQDFRARRSPTLNRVAEVVVEAMKRGQIKKDDRWEVAMGLWAHIHGYLMLYRAGRFSLSQREFRALCRRSLRRFIQGLAR